MKPPQLDYYDSKGTLIDYDLYWMAYHNYIYECKMGEHVYSFTYFINNGVSDKYIINTKQTHRKLKIKEIFSDIE
jgi:hypothetical protein